MLTPLGYAGLGVLGRAQSVPSSLLTGLAAYWALEEASGTRVDATGRGNDLAPTAAPGNAAGTVGQALSLNGTTQYLSRASTSDLQFGAGSFTVAAWLYLSSATANAEYWAVSKGSAALGGVGGEYRFGRGNQNKWQFQYSNSAANAFGTVRDVASTTGAWTSVIGWYDLGAGTINLQTNNGTPTTVSVAGITPYSSTGTFFLGAQVSASLWPGMLDEVGLWKRVLTSAERTALYNSGAGRTYPFSGT